MRTRHSSVARKIVVQPLTTLERASPHRLIQSVSPANFGSSSHARTALEARRLDTLRAHTSYPPLVATLQRSVRTSAPESHTGGGAVIAAMMPLTGASNTWRSCTVMWDKWLLFCSTDSIEPLTGSESSFLHYLCWLLESNTISGLSVCNYLSAVDTAHKHVILSLSMDFLLPLSIAAYQQDDSDRKLLTNP